VADLRAGTPSIAAERAVPVKAELSARVADAAARLSRAPMRRVETWAQQLDGLSCRMAPALKEIVARMETRFQRSALRLEPPLRSAAQNAAHRLEQASARLVLLDPLGVLRRGYSITMDEKGHVVQSAAVVAAEQTLTTRFADGAVRSRVLPKEG
jgi:exodeoxyribonuclease VII large subunit